MMRRQPDFWAIRNHPFSYVLAPLSWLWQFGTYLRAQITTPYRAPLKVICVGNIAIGGSGKTPAAIAIAQYLKNKKIIFLTRGYGGMQRRAVLINHATDATLYGDEALLLSRIAPTIVARNRTEGLKLAQQQGFDIVIVDDGFQNPGFAKDVSILVIDGARGLGNGHVIPAGPLRETPEAAAARAQAVLIVGDDITNVQNLFPNLRQLHGDFTVTGNAPDKSMPYVAFAGIGHPDKFFTTLRQNGYSLAETVSFPDHHAYTDADLDRLKRLAQRHKSRLITTEKDHVRLPVGADVDQLPVTMTIQGDLDGLLS